MNNLRLTVVVLFTILTSQSQTKTWTLKDCIHYALQNDLLLKQLALDEKANQKKVIAQYGEFLPSVNMYADHNYNFGSTINPSTNTRVSSDIQSNNFALSTSLKVFDWSNFINLKRAKLEKEKAKYDLKIEENELIIKIAQTYYQLQYDREQLYIINTRLENSKIHLLRIEEEVSKGAKAKSDLYDMQANFANGLQQQLEVNYQYKTAYLRLQNLLNIKDSISFTAPLDVVVTSFESEDIKYIFNKGLEFRPEIRSGELAQSIRKKTLQQQRSAYIPTINANYSFSSFYSRTVQGINDAAIPFNTQFNDNKNHFIGFSLNIPVFNKLQTRSNVQVSKIELEKTTLAFELKKQLYYETLKEAQLRTQQSYYKWKSSENTSKAQMKSFEKVEKRFIAGLIDSFGFFRVKDNLLSAEYNQLKAKYEYFYNASLLNFYVSGNLQ